MYIHIYAIWCVYIYKYVYIFACVKKRTQLFLFECVFIHVTRLFSLFIVAGVALVLKGALGLPTGLGELAYETFSGAALTGSYCWR